MKGHEKLFFNDIYRLFLFSAITPAFIIWIMCIAFQDDPKDLSFGVVNLEVPNNTICAAAQGQVTPGECDVENLSCKYIEHLPQGILSLVSVLFFL